ncbi:MAG: DPP IV N-terminal domain-containing protein, partial [Abditibacteriales bacterium]|nr:DPP IV N-terminal domain-containing protein [Abditibacteriales bacterium]MDW8367628.1 DPP IV N-terminal domain-containing protein [Abditibacteriales bacterium]
MKPLEFQGLTKRIESLEHQSRRWRRIGGGLLVLAVAVLAMGAAHAQDRLRTMPRYDRYARLRGEILGSYQSGALSVTWTDGGKAFEFSREGKRYRYDIAERRAVEIGSSGNPAPANPPFGNRFPPRGAFAGRGRQIGSTTSPDGQWRAFYRDRNLWLSKADGKDEIAVTTDGNEKTRIKYGTASWVYGEELGQTTAMWWSPDSKKIAFYRFDESQVRDYYITLNHLQVQNTLEVEPFPKPGTPNPVVDVLIYDLATKKTVTVDVRDGQPFDDAVVGHYVYNVQWSPDGR